MGRSRPVRYTLDELLQGLPPAAPLVGLRSPRAALKGPLLGRAVAGQIVKALGITPKKPKKKIVLADRSEQLLSFDMGAAAKYFSVELDGKSRYILKQMQGMLIEPRPDMAAISIPDATPEIVEQYALDDEQALLAKIRYNRLIDIFLGIATFSLQNHLRTSVEMRAEKGSRSQIEIDEIYVGVDKKGQHYVIPVQAKGGKDKLSKMQSRQDIAWCKQRLPDLECRAISAQFVSDEIVLFLLKEVDHDIKVEEEKRYKLFRKDRSDTTRVRASSHPAKKLC